MQGKPTRLVDAVIFDLDGVLTSTSEYHFRAWKRLAGEEGIPFTREDNDALRGVSRRESLRLLLNGRAISEAQAEEWMARKNNYYREMIQSISPAEVLPGALALLEEIRESDIKSAVASASRNAADVVAGLGIGGAVDGLVSGERVTRAKPAPDLFLEAARDLGVPPARCVVVEDAAAGVAAAKAAGMVAVGLGPEARFGVTADLVLPDLDGVRLADLTRAATWRVAETAFDPETQRTTEAVMAQGNGYLSTRATLEERTRADQQVTLMHGMWDDAPVAYTELANTPDWTNLDLTVNGVRFALTNGTVSDYARWLDLRHGILRRRLRWQPVEGGPLLDLTLSRFPSLADPHVLAVRLEIECLDGEADITVGGAINTHVENAGLLHWTLLEQNASSDEISVLAETRQSGKAAALAMRLIASDPAATIEGDDCPGCPGQTVTLHLSAGQNATVEKLGAIFTSRDVERPLDEVRSKIAKAAEAGWVAIQQAHIAAWEAYWQDGDVIVEGDDEAQLAIRHALYHLRIAASPTDDRVSMAAKTLTGFGYRGHAFWDTEIFILPYFTHTHPTLAKNLLMYRWHTLEGARRNAQRQGYSGARFPWESAETGDEVTPAWLPNPKNPAEPIRIWCRDIELHITADVAYAMWQYWKVTGDDEFMREVGAPIILETAVYWGERAEKEKGSYAIRDVIGPDENHEHVDNDIFTNRMVKWHLETALELHQWFRKQSPRVAEKLYERLDLFEKRLARWRDVASKITLLWNRKTGLMEQFEGFFELEEVDWPALEGRTESIQAILGIEGANRVQAIKQPSAVLLTCLLRDEFDQKTRRANWTYYAPRTDHTYGSSLGPAMHAWAACEMGEIDLAYEHFLRAARTDLYNTRGNTPDGIHGATMGGLWQAIVFGFAGLHTKGKSFTTTPRMPKHWKRLAFTITLHGQRHRIDLRPDQAVAG